MGWLVLIALVFGAGVLAGYRWAWLDHYERGRDDATKGLSKEAHFISLGSVAHRRVIHGAWFTGVAGGRSAAAPGYVVPLD